MKQYLKDLKYILDKGSIRENRSGIDTIGIFGLMSKYDISKSFPLITTKKMFWKGIVHELIWMLKGDTNIKYLNDNGVHIWDKNADAFYENNSIVKKGDLGPVYGKQWRDFNGFDQINYVIDQIKNNSMSRRIIFSAWNPPDIEKMALPPCHIMAQFYVENEYLSCMMTQRSADMFLGVPFNIASYSLLTYIIANICNLKPGKFIHSIGDAHIYTNHIEQVKEQINRDTFDLPVLKINKNISDINDISFNNFELIGYNYHPTIKAEMAV